MSIDPSAVIVAVIVAAGNVGAIKILVDRTLKRIDDTATATQDQAVIIERTVQAQKATAETLKQVQESVTDLYESRNSLEKRADRTDHLHKLKKCEDNVFFQGPPKGVKS